MNENQALIQKFYTAFQNLDAKAMQECYGPNPIFSDPVFGILEGSQVGAMWEMLCKNAREFTLTFNDIQILDPEYASCRWTAVYRFSATGRMVTNHVKAYLRIEKGKITEHTDQFDFWKWARQALGARGLLLGWTGYLRARVHRAATGNLGRFMSGR
jgi:ketosteroid isomerase-like protein